MRTFTSPVDGSDVSFDVKFLLTHSSTYRLANLYTFQTMGFWYDNSQQDYYFWTFTDADTPISVGWLQLEANGSRQLGTWNSGFTPQPLTYLPEKFARDKIDYKIGFESQNYSVQWWIDDSKEYVVGQPPLSSALTPVNLTLKQAMTLGAFDEAPFWIHRAVFGLDNSLLGTSPVFRGFIHDTEVAQDHLIIKITNLLEKFQSGQVPTQIIEPSDREPPYYPSVLAPFQLGVVIAAISPTVIQFSSNNGLTFNQLADVGVSFVPGISSWYDNVPNFEPPPPVWRISGNDGETAGTIVVYFYEPPIIPPTSIPILYSAVPLTGPGVPGFPLVPVPEQSV